MKLTLCLPLLTSFILFGCSKNSSEQPETEKLYSESMSFSTTGNVTYFEVINADTKKRVAYGENPKIIREELDKDLIQFRRTYKEVIKVKPGENLRLIIPYSEKRTNITISIGSILSGSGLSSQLKDNIQYLDFKIASKLYD
ncbi:hypothetical protein [Sphingobacterium paramultivorum]|uniref:hypothetical protein n=1 Tax=Sphingobacterium paramultivorum TaxID=2886510 RepID=UPI00129CD952|nr:hypothetical protein [Sphingobacterium paramultivorum]